MWERKKLEALDELLFFWNYLRLLFGDINSDSCAFQPQTHTHTHMDSGPIWKQISLAPKDAAVSAIKPMEIFINARARELFRSGETETT